MRNKFFKHVSNNRIGYVIGAVLVAVVGVSLGGDTGERVADFHDPANSSMMVGDVSSLLGNEPGFTFEAADVVYSGEPFSVTWDNGDSQDQASIYLVPANKSDGEAVKLTQLYGEKTNVSLDEFANGDYFFGMMTGRNMAISDTFTLTNDISAIESYQMDLMSESLEVQQSELLNLKASARSSEVAVTQIQAQVNDMESQLNAAQTEMTLKQSAVAQAKTKVATAELEVANAQSAVNALENQLNLSNANTQQASDSDYKYKIVVVNESLDQKQSELALAQENVAALESELKLTSNRLEAAALQAELTLSKAEVTTLKSDIDTLKAEITAQEAKLADSMAVTSSESVMAQNQVLSLETELNQAKADLQIAQVTLNTAMDELKVAEQAFTASELQVTELQTELATMKTELQMMKAEAVNEAANADVLDAVITQQQMQLENSQMKLTTPETGNSETKFTVSLGGSSFKDADSNDATSSTNDLNVTTLSDSGPATSMTGGDSDHDGKTNITNPSSEPNSATLIEYGIALPSNSDVLEVKDTLNLLAN